MVDSSIEDKVSILIPSFNGGKLLKECISSVLNYTTYPDYEIIVSDDNSIDKDTIKILNDYQDKIIVDFGKERLYHGKRTTRALNLSNGQFVVFMNDDTSIAKEHKNWLDILVKFLKTNKDIIGTVTPVQLHDKNNKTIYWYGRNEKNRNKPGHDYINIQWGSSCLPKTPVLYSWYNNFGCCLTYSAYAKNILLGFDTPPHYGSDSSFCTQLTKKFGLKHACITSVYVYHLNAHIMRKKFQDKY